MAAIDADGRREAKGYANRLMQAIRTGDWDALYQIGTVTTSLAGGHVFSAASNRGGVVVSGEIKAIQQLSRLEHKNWPPLIGISRIKAGRVRDRQDARSAADTQSNPQFMLLSLSLSCDGALLPVPVLLAFGISSTSNSSFYILAYTPTYGIKTLHLPASTGFTATRIGGLVLAIGCPLAGYWSDRMAAPR